MDKQTLGVACEMLDLAKKNINLSYAKYSNFCVCAVVKCGDKFFYGVNIENSSFSLTMCAERVAVFKAVSEGYLTFDKILVYHNGEQMPFPCGACLQVINQFSNNCDIFVANDKKIEEYNLKELFPKGFNF